MSNKSNAVPRARHDDVSAANQNIINAQSQFDSKKYREELRVAMQKNDWSQVQILIKSMSL